MPPWPVMKTKTFDRSSDSKRFERGTEASTRPVNGEDHLRRGFLWREAGLTCENAKEILHGDLVPAVVDLYVITIEVEGTP